MGHFNCFCISVEIGAHPLHKGRNEISTQRFSSINLVDIRPRKKIFSPPPPNKKFPNSPQRPSHPLGPSPPPWDFSIENRFPSDSPFPLPKQEKIKNIRNVHQVKFFQMPLGRPHPNRRTCCPAFGLSKTTEKGFCPGPPRPGSGIH